MNHVRLEVCVDNAAGLRAAVKGGADRIELCSALALGGLTPSAGLIALAANSPVPVRAMIRPRAGNFQFSADEVYQMKTDIDAVRNSNLEGVVLGVSTGVGELDLATLRELRTYSFGMPATLHRVVDTLADPETAVETAIQLGFDTILTSGGSKTAVEGLSKLVQMHTIAAGRITVMPGSGIRVENAADILKATGAGWLHASCTSSKSTSDKLHKLGFAPESEPKTDEQVCREISDICQAIKRPAR